MNSNRRDHGDGGIDERGPDRWRLRWCVDGKRFTKSFHGPVGEARKELRRLIKSADDGQHVAPDKITVERYLSDWLDADTGISPKTRERIASSPGCRSIRVLARSQCRSCGRLRSKPGTRHCSIPGSPRAP